MKSNVLIKFFATCFLISVSFNSVTSQNLFGFTGLLTTPSAETHHAGTFIGGAGYLPQVILPRKDIWNYNTGTYHIDFFMFSFIELNMRMTLKQRSNGRYQGQDRTSYVKIRVLKERDLLPALAIGASDIAGSTNGWVSYFAVATKKIHGAWGYSSLTTGYYFPFGNEYYYKGLFGGITYTSPSIENIKFIAEYDSERFNLGVNVLLINHISITAALCNMESASLGICYKTTLTR
ncbi:MAG TPA: YjbH domain-containing protein [Bacteroidaceae bacterium]|nr:YjbH domain-containing protein [Bacteroidaceae bacterium]